MQSCTTGGAARACGHHWHCEAHLGAAGSISHNLAATWLRWDLCTCGVCKGHKPDSHRALAHIGARVVVCVLLVCMGVCARCASRLDCQARCVLCFSLSDTSTSRTAKKDEQIGWTSSSRTRYIIFIDKSLIEVNERFVCSILKPSAISSSKYY